MSKKKLVAYRLPEPLIQMIKETALIMDRTESDAVRIILFRACKYWISKSTITTMNKRIVNDMEDNIDELEASIAHLK